MTDQKTLQKSNRDDRPPRPKGKGKRGKNKAAAAAEAEPPAPAEEEEAYELYMPPTVEDATSRNPHLKEYLDGLAQEGKPMPAFHAQLSRDLKGERPYNFLYPVGDPIFIHIHEEEDGMFPYYTSIMPQFEEGEDALYAALRTSTFQKAPKVEVPEEEEMYRGLLDELLETQRKGGTIKVQPDGAKKPVALTEAQEEKFRFMLYRDLVEHGIVEPIMKDPWIEDIHALGTKPLHPIHKIFGTSESNIQFKTTAEIDAWVETMGERMGRPVSNANPVVDGALPNGSRINIIYGEEVSKGGTSWTVRKFSDVPIPVSQIVAWGTFSPEIAAYLWLCLEYGMSVFVAGETASGKTTSTNSILPFIRPKSKIMTAEDTPEVLPPHANWQQLITRDRGTSESSVHMYDLLRAGLRSRPNYIIVGEIRGAEGAVAFQAMQTGHPTMATFHASSVGKLIQRFTSDPINVPVQFMPNLNVVLIQMAVYVHGKMLRRVLAVEEIEGYSKRTDSAITRQVFNWDSVHDRFMFGGRNNSYVLEQLVAPKMGLKDPRDVYKVMEKRKWIIEELIRREMFDYHEVGDILFDYSEKRNGALPFPVDEEYDFDD